MHESKRLAKIPLLFLALFLLPTCTHKAEINPPRDSVTEYTFLGLKDNECHKIESKSALKGIIDITKVTLVEYSQYMKDKESKSIIAEDNANGFVYYCTTTLRHVPISNSASAIIKIENRYKALIPGNVNNEHP